MKEKIKEHISKHSIIYGAILIFFCIAGYGMADINLTLSDEMFNFANIFKLYNGVELYSENNIIVTPLYFYLVNFIFKLFGANMLVFKIINVIIFEIIMVIIIKMLKKLGVPVVRSVVYILLLIFPFLRDLFVCGTNYNTLAMLFWLLGMNFIIKKDKLEVKALEQGIISALVFATKQNIGIYYLLGITLFTLYNHKKELKIAIKKILGIYTVFAIITAGWCLILALNGQFKDFINYCFLGIGEFSKNNTSMLWGEMLYYIIPISIIIGVIIWVKKYKISKDNKIYKTIIFLGCFMIAALPIGYPIFNSYHVKLSIVPSVILLIYLGNCIMNLISDLLKHKAIFIVIVIYITILIILNFVQIGLFIGTLSNPNYELEYNDGFYGTRLAEGYKNALGEISTFIKEKEAEGKEVIIFSGEANLYEVPLGRHKKDYDLPYLGNWGYKGEERIINEIKNFKKTYVIMREEDYIGQESERVKDVIKEEYESMGDLAGYKLYYKE